MKQVIVIHGGTTFINYDDYLEYLGNGEVSLDRFTRVPTWKETLQSKLSDEYKVLLPSMPNATNAKYLEWKLWFDNISQLFIDDCILVGHSLGGIFLAKYLSEHTMPCKISATILIAAPYNDETSEDLGDFKIDSLSNTFRSQVGKAIIYYGSDDPVIAASEADRYREQLPDAEYYELSAPDHFVRTDFPELVTAIQSL